MARQRWIQVTATQTRAGAERGSEETFFTLDQIAERLQLSKESVRRIFSREPGVLRFNSLGKASTANGRVRLRIPSSVYNRVVNKLRHID